MTSHFRRRMFQATLCLLGSVLLWACMDPWPLPPPTDPTVYRYFRDYEYAEGIIYDLGGIGDFIPGDSVEQVFVYREIPDGYPERPPSALYANLYVDPDQPGAYSGEDLSLDSGGAGVILLGSNYYSLISVPDSNRHIVVFRYSEVYYSLGVILIVRRNDSTLDTVGTFASGELGSPLTLKLIYNKDANQGFRTWDYMWRNVYSIPRGLTIREFSVTVLKGLPGAEETQNSVPYQTDSSGATQPYLQILGLDQYSSAGKIPDGQLDNRYPVFWPSQGLIIFPSRRPFADTVISFVDANGNRTQRLKDPAMGIYYYQSSRMREMASKYFLRITFP